MSLVDSVQNAVVKNDCEDQVVLVLPNKPEYVSVARLAVSGIAGRMGFDVETVEDIKLALAEACTNAIKHGCCEEYSEYRIEFGIGQKCLTISITDKGCGMDKKAICQPDLKNPREGGLGIFIISTLMDRVEFETAPEAGLTITMKKYLGV
ncbi:MAG: ATP-binding protein [Bacillota bacterium]|jgi:serine/threonine-protein kinase RsbW|nr:ATP-binding protein [Bacillota bacterium]MDD3297736.1 ATP-binding protein [Bacillota bacterium]MDD3850072.1 ATP-binding protein [Bacillota bacterium]MDD4706691.1 ATP-binding protein [Bacillota bacterium]